MARDANLTTFHSPSPLLAHQYYHSPPVNSLAGPADDSCQFVLAFSDLSYSVKTPVKLSLFRKKRRRTWEPTRKLLDSISGEVKTGEILAVLGASGSSKTTLIDALANRIERTSLRGSITLNGEKLEGRLLKAISAYVMQDDLMFPMLTVEETLMFAAEVRLPPSVSAFRKKERVQALIDQLDLRPAANTIIGDEGHRGVSGGERRRVSIGTDIIHDPVILFLDEPTSGLDSTSAFMVVQVLQRIARSGSMVIMSVHQPSYRILGLLDRLIFLSRGQMVYGGPPHGLPEFFAAYGNPVPDGGNPAEFAIDLIRELEDSSPDGARGLVALNALNHEARAKNRAEPCPPLQDAVRNSIARGKLVSGAMIDGSAAPASYANPLWVEVPVVTKRALINMWRMPEILAFRLGDMLITGFLIGTIFWQLQDSPQALRERIGFFVITIVTIYFTSTDTLGVYIQEKYIHKRETAYNAYRLTSYVLSNAITTFLPLVFLTAALVPIVFFSVGLAVDGFLFFFMTILATFWAGSGFVTFISGVLSHVVLGYTVAAAILSYFLLLGGFFINRNQIPSYWIWFHYLSLLKYPYEAVMQNEFSNPSRCFSRGVQIFDGTAIGKLPAEKKMEVLTAVSQALGFSISNDTCMTTGSDVLEYQRIDQLNKWNCLLVTVAWGFFFRFLFYFSLLFGSRNKRK